MSKNRRWEMSKEGRDYMRLYHVKYKARFKRIVYDYYGWYCKCCGESEPQFLSVDHINNDGFLDRRAKLSGASFYKKIIAEGMPSYYQILCMNCNFGKKVNGGVCPHLK